jgi:hypothetical protein
MGVPLHIVRIQMCPFNTTLLVIMFLFSINPNLIMKISDAENLYPYSINRYDFRQNDLKLTISILTFTFK